VRLARPDVLLVCMPWASPTRPSLGIGLLVAAARRSGFRCRAVYPNVEFSSLFGPEAYEEVCSKRDLLALGEHLFAVDVFGRKALRSSAFLERFLRLQSEDGADRSPQFDPTTLYDLRDVVVPDALDRCAERILRTPPDVVGFSCVFSQVMPSLALARRLKAARPGMRILLGGACVHGCVGEAYAGAFRDTVDHVFTGEADVVFPAFLESLAAGRDGEDLPGVTHDGVQSAPAEPVTDLDALPEPDYDDYFAARAECVAAVRRLLACRELPFESSRGCWWGHKNHCSFCGINGVGMAYRVKSVDRVVGELEHLAMRYHSSDLEAADSILPHAAYRGLLPRVAALGLDLRLTYEIKANVTRDDVAALRAAGVVLVQPGVESFSDHVLQLMRKGVTGLQNVQLLKWLQEFGIGVYYHVLVGFPGETDADYEAMHGLLPALFHLPPPVLGHSATVKVHRFAPFFDEPRRWGIRGVRPAWHYRHLIPPSAAPAADYAFFFDRDIAADAPLFRHRARLDAAIRRWVANRRKLTAKLGPGFITILQTVQPAKERELAVLDRDAACVFLLCDARTSIPNITRTMESMRPGAVVDVPSIIADLVRRRLVVASGQHFVGVVPFERPHPTAVLQGWLRRWGAGPGFLDPTAPGPTGT